MSSKVFNPTPFLPTSRRYPVEINELAFQINLSYVDIANAVNARTISLFPTIRPGIGGESWFITQNKRQISFRQVYTFTAITPIEHGIPPGDVERFVRMFGTFTNGTNTFGMIAGTTVAIAGQRTFYVTPTQIIFVVGAGAPALTQGTIVLEWISQP